MTEPTPGRQSSALRAALAETAPQRIAQDALDVDTVTSAPQLEGLAATLQRWHAAALLGDPIAHTTPYAVEVLRQAAGLAVAAKVWGYPRPPLEALGAQAGTLPASRTFDPPTARESGERTRSTPNATNHLGALLRAFRRVELERPRGSSDTDRTMTSEEAARHAGLERSEYAKRCSDLLALGYIRVARDDDGHERTRQGRSGRQRLVFELTDDGRRLADVLLAD